MIDNTGRSFPIAATNQEENSSISQFAHQKEETRNKNPRTWIYTAMGEWIRKHKRVAAQYTSEVQKAAQWWVGDLNEPLQMQAP